MTTVGRNKDDRLSEDVFEKSLGDNLVVFKERPKIDKERILEVVGRMTWEGRPVDAYYATSPKEAAETLQWLRKHRAITDEDYEACGSAWRCVWALSMHAVCLASDKAIRAKIEQIEEPQRAKELLAAHKESELYKFLNQADLLPAFEAGLGFIINLGDVVIAVAAPQCYFDDNDNLHRTDGPALEWEGEKYYYHSGFRIDPQWIEDPDSLDPTTVFNIPDADMRTIFTQIVGWDKILESLDAKLIDEDPDPLIGALYEAKLPGIDEPWRFLIAKCPAGGRPALPVLREHKTALEANAWTYGLDEDTLRMMECRT